MTLTSYGAANRVIDRGLAVCKDCQCVLGSWTGNTVVASGASTTYSSMWRSVRTATMAYRYVGMDLATATECATAMRTYWTRSTRTSIWKPTEGEMGDWVRSDSYSSLMADVTVVKAGDGPMFDVEISVHERDEQWAKTSASVSWTTEDAREYDGGEG